MTRETKFGFPFDSIPSSWYQIAWEGEVGNGEVRPLHYFGRDLVFYRTDDGDHVVMDAFCPHYGAHLGHGGTVKGCDLVCPFHGWQWSPDGRNTGAPLDGRPRPEVGIRTYPTMVRNSIVWVWFDANGREPDYEIEELINLPGNNYRAVYPDCTHRWQDIHLIPQYLVENTVDGEHFKWVHGAKGPITIAIEPKRPTGKVVDLRISMVFGYGKEKTWLTPDGPVEADLLSQIWGMGANLARFGPTDGAILIESHTPIDAERSNLFISVFLPVPDGADPSSPLTEREQARIREQIVQLDRDLPILENMRYVQNPAYGRTEGSLLGTIRHWSEQFYAELAEKAVPIEKQSVEFG
jgi:3-ketosteroid 9alpha-monooxygenase subunit A